MTLRQPNNISRLQLTTARTLIVADTNFAVGDPKRDPRALQASECHELLNPTRTSCLILAQRQPGKLADYIWINKNITTESLVTLGLNQNQVKNRLTPFP